MIPPIRSSASLDASAVSACVVVAHHTARVVLIDLWSIPAIAANVKIGAAGADGTVRLHSSGRRRRYLGRRSFARRLGAPQKDAAVRHRIDSRLVRGDRLSVGGNAGVGAALLPSVLTVKTGRVVGDKHRTESASATDPVRRKGHHFEGFGRRY